MLFLRDGVSDSEWQSMLGVEIPAIRAAFAKFASEKALAWEPKLTVVVCVKKHHTRALGTTPDGQEGKMGNIVRVLFFLVLVDWG